MRASDFYPAKRQLQFRSSANRKTSCEGFEPNYRKVPQIFPAILKEKNGTWTDLVVSTSGLYEGNRAKQYCVSITGECFSGLVVGVATYSTSDDGGRHTAVYRLWFNDVVGVALLSH